MMIARGLLDQEGCLKQADPPLADLHERAGGKPDGLLAIPEIAAIIHQARMQTVPVARAVIVADGAEMLKLWVEASPQAEGILLSLSGWETRVDPPDIAQFADLQFDRTRLVSDAAWRTAADLRITRMAAGVDRRIGFLPATARGLPFTRVFRLMPDMAGDLPLLTALAAGRSFVDQPAELLPADASPVLLSGSPEYDELGEFCGLTGSLNFISRAPNPFERSASDDLDQIIATRLETALRLPISRMIEHADAIALQADGPLRRDYARYGSDVAGAARHLLGLVDDLGSVQEIERADLPIRVEPVDLSDLARRASGLLAVRMVEKSINFELVDLGIQAPALGDFGRVLQILVNLISNAVRYTTENGTIYVTIRGDAEESCVSVKDEGRGIPLEDQARIFEKFERLDPSEPGGSGLGLYISRRLARAMGGDVTVQSAPGKGACFTLRLPTSLERGA